MTRPSPTTGYAAAHAASLCLREIPCRCGHPDYYHRDTYHGDPCTHWLCDCGSYDPEDDMLDNDDTWATGIAVIAALAVWVAALIAIVWFWTRP